MRRRNRGETEGEIRQKRGNTETKEKAEHLTEGEGETGGEIEEQGDTLCRSNPSNYPVNYNAANGSSPPTAIWMPVQLAEARLTH